MNADNVIPDAVQNRFTAYLNTALKNNSAKCLRSKRLQEERETLFDPLQEPAILAVDDFTANLPIIHQFENQTLVEQLISAPQQTRDILILKVVYQYTFSQIADMLGLHYKNVSAIYYRFINRLKKKLEDSEQ